MLHLHSGILLSHKKNEIMLLAQHDHNYRLTSKSDREKQISHDITYTCNLKYDTNQLIYEIKTDSDIENRLVTAKGEQEGRSRSLGLADANYHI